MADLGVGQRFVSIEDQTFTRARRAHLLSDQVRVQILTRRDLLTSDQLALPPDGVIDLGGADDGRYLGQGWLRPEAVGGASARWIGNTLVGVVRVALPPHDVTFTLRGLAYPPNQAVTVRVNGEQVGSEPLAQGWQTVTFVIDGALLDAEIDTIELSHNAMQSPFDATEGASSDVRELAAAYDWMQFSER